MGLVFHGNKTTKEPYLGIELEIDTDSNSYTEGQIAAAKTFLFKELEILDEEDGGGIELQFPPMKYSFLLSKKNKFIELFDYVNGLNDASTDTSTSAGMHIHIDKSAFTLDQFKRMFKFFIDYPELTEFIANRQPRHEYSKQAAVSNRLNSHDKPFDNFDDYYSHYAPLRIFTLKNIFDCGFLAINRKGYPTIEFRMFQSTSDINKFFTNIEFVQSMWLLFGQNSKKTKVKDSVYLNFVTTHKDKLPHLYSYLKSFKCKDKALTVRKVVKKVARKTRSEILVEAA